MRIDLSTRSQIKVKMLSAILTFLFVNPLREYYLRAPSWAGGWEGKTQEEICAILTPRTTPEFWGINTLECETMVNNHFTSFLVVGYMILFCFCLYKVVGAITNCAHLFMIRRHVTEPILETIASLKDNRLKIKNE